MLCARPPHRKPPKASIGHRFRMLELALEPYSGFHPDDQEIQRPGPSYTVDTLIGLRREYGDRPLCLILGLDAFLGLKSWHRWQEVCQMANIIVLSRPGWEPDEAIDHVDIDRLRRSKSGLVAFWSGVDMPVSSTEIRRRLGSGEDVSDQIPTKVLKYIYENKLYGESEYG